MEQPQPSSKGEKAAGLPTGRRGAWQGGEGLQPTDDQDGRGADEGSGDAGEGGRGRGQVDHGAAAEDRDEGKVQDDAPCLHQPATGRSCKDWKERMKNFKSPNTGTASLADAL